MPNSFRYFKLPHIHWYLKDKPLVFYGNFQVLENYLNGEVGRLAGSLNVTHALSFFLSFFLFFLSLSSQIFWTTRDGAKKF